MTVSSPDGIWVDPRVQCPPDGNPAEAFYLGPLSGGVYACPNDECIIDRPLWELHEGATEMWCANTQEGVLIESAHIPIEVPEPAWPGMLAAALVAVTVCYVAYRS